MDRTSVCGTDNPSSILGGCTFLFVWRVGSVATAIVSKTISRKGITGSSPVPSALALL